MAFTEQQQKIYNHLRNSLPRFLFQKWKPDGSDVGGQEIWGGFVLLFDQLWTQALEWFTNAFVQQSSGIWLSQHAIDRGTFRQANETDAALRERLSIVEDVITKPALKAGVDAILAAFGETTECTIVELRGDGLRAFFGLNDLTPTDRAKSYFTRGYRLTSSDASAGFIVILPYPTSTTVRDAVNEYVKGAKAAGIYHKVEVRLSA
jgi:hypothetical protein